MQLGTVNFCHIKWFKLCLYNSITNSPTLFVCYSLPQEDSDYERDHTPPTPPPRKLSRKGMAYRLGCIGKQGSDENPLMRRVGQPLKLTQSQVNKVGIGLMA